MLSKISHHLLFIVTFVVIYLQFFCNDGVEASSSVFKRNPPHHKRKEHEEVVPPWRQSLTTCWNNVSCRRALIVSHGGDWNLERPYDSLPAFQKAYEDTSDCVKGDLLVSKDNVAVVMHSSPIKFYESLECAGELVQNKTAEQLEQCKMALTNDTFISVPELLKWAEGRVNVMLCVKSTADIPRAIQTLIECNATHRAFLEIAIPHLLETAMEVPGWEKVYFLAEVRSMSQLTTALTSKKFLDHIRHRCPILEFDPSFVKWGIANFTETVERIHSLGMKTFTATSEFLPSVESQVELFHSGIDVVYTYDTVNGVKAREMVDKARGIPPPY